MGFWRGVGYFFAIIIIIVGLLLLPSIIGIAILIGGIVFIWMLRKNGQVASMKNDLKYLADSERERIKGLADSEREMAEAEKGLADSEREMADVEREMEKRKEK